MVVGWFGCGALLFVATRCPLRSTPRRTVEFCTLCIEMVETEHVRLSKMPPGPSGAFACRVSTFVASAILICTWLVNTVTLSHPAAEAPNVASLISDVASLRREIAASDPRRYEELLLSQFWDVDDVVWASTQERRAMSAW